jgi:dihydrofolate reductase
MLYPQIKLSVDAVLIAGRRTYDDSVRWWGAEGPHPPTRVFVVTHEAPDAVPEGSVYTFVADGIESALEQAKEVAGDNDVAVMGGPDISRQFIDAGLVDEINQRAARMGYRAAAWLAWSLLAL